MININKEKVKEFFEEHGFYVALLGLCATGLGVIVHSSVKADKANTAAYAQLCCGTMAKVEEYFNPARPIKVEFTKAIAETCGTGV